MKQKDKRDEPKWCKLYREQVIKPKQRQRLTEQSGRTAASRDGFYNTRGWKIIREKRINSNPLCQRCEAAGYYRRAEVVDHIEPVDLAPHLALTYSNTQSLCSRCHSIKTMQDKRKRQELEKQRIGAKLMEDLENG